ncbi:MAG: DUF1294 domain-containing protein [Alistipes sp.]|nr:DUF1294 domain-containing protein [Alistipes sp.]
MIYAIAIYLTAITLITFIAFAIDKSKSKSKSRRIPELTLLIMSAIGGSLGALLAMHFVRHKTQHAKFKYGIPAMLAAHIALLAYVLLW